MDNRKKYTRDIYRALFLIIGIFVGAISIKWGLWEAQQAAWAESQVPMLLSPLADAPVYAREAPETPKPPTERELVIAEIERVFGDDSAVMKRVAFCESGYNPRAKNPKSSATGVFQIMAGVHGVSPRFLTNPYINIAIAKQLYDNSGLEPWRASNNCHHGLDK